MQRLSAVSPSTLALLTGIAEQPDLPIAELPMLTPAELPARQLERHFPRIPHEVTLASLFEQQVATTPEAIAVTIRLTS